jgi:hypothetical protein
MSRLLYEKSVSYQGHLIIPFVFTKADDQPIYSYKLLSELGHKGNFHQADNPAGMYSDNCENIVKIAKEHLDVNSDVSSESSDVTFFKRRYTYRYNLIILHGKAGKYFYDHYRPDSLNNIAAPKIFESEIECISWIKQGLDRAPSREQPKKA